MLKCTTNTLDCEQFNVYSSRITFSSKTAKIIKGEITQSWGINFPGEGVENSLVVVFVIAA